MRIFILALLISFSSFAIAQMPAGMQEAIQCMESLDKQALEDLGKQGEKVSEDIKALCKNGDESGARARAMDYMESMEDNEAVAELKRCSEMMREVMPGMPMPDIPTAETYAAEAGSICDDTD